jgi:uncharacterized protein YdhG (YjbR/CyaY superfamily)
MAASNSVEEYLNGLPEAQRVALEQLRATIRAAAPDVTETISYGMPAFRLRGRVLVWIAAFKDHCSLFPGSKAVMAAHAHELRAYGTSQGTIRFPADRPLPAALVRSIVEARIEENEARSAQ